MPTSIPRDELSMITRLETAIGQELPQMQFPNPYRPTDNPVAIVLGADPTYIPKGEENPVSFAVVFNLSEVNDKRFFGSIEGNLSQIGLTKEQIYVQNLCRNYF